MKILAHRGWWLAESEKNTMRAFVRALEAGFGIETDVRDCSGSLVICHDPPAGNALAVEGLLAECRSTSTTVAINIKADGLQDELKELLDRYQIKDYFLFDQSVPDAIQSLRRGLRVFTRQSEYEPAPAFYAWAQGVVLDGFLGDWADSNTVKGHLSEGKEVCLISPDVHKRAHLSLWTQWRRWSHSDRIMLCTDRPQEACDTMQQTGQ